jgi:hypothetical protein
MNTSNSVASSNSLALTNGFGAAAILAAGVGCFAVGVLATVGDGVKAVARALTFYRPTGPLSGVSTMAIVVWLVTWFVLARRWSGKTVSMTKVNAAAFVFLAVGLLLTFPPFEDLLLGK